jgi:8-oxo-dGTP diphosphatase
MSNLRIRVVAAVATSAEKFLLGRRPLEKRHGGLWEFPGGKCLPEEDDTTAISRELREELAVNVCSVGPSLFEHADPGSPFDIVFLPVEFDGAPNCLEHVALDWFSLESLSDLPLAPTDRLFVQFLLKEK